MAKLTLVVGWCLLVVVASQDNLPSQEVLNEIFGVPSTTPSTTVTQPPNPLPNRLEEVIIRPTDSTTVFTDSEGRPCKCVPYYLCDPETNLTINDPTQTGFGFLDIRFREDDCQESTEKCCFEPQEPGTVVQPPPDPSRLKGCGFRNPRGLDFTITGGSGNEAQFGEFPWVVALLNAQNNSLAGAGSLIHPNVVITGAHNLRMIEASALKIRAGEWDTQTIKERLPHQERPVAEAYVHPGFNKQTLYNDIALLRLAEPVLLADHINVICLPTQDFSFDTSKQCVANGWGKDVFGKPGRYAVILKRVEQDIVPNPRCSDLLQRTRLGRKFQLDPSFVCAGGEEGKDTCQGDGGAPLACPAGDDRYRLSGLVAWGIGCGQKDVPAVYTRVAKYRQWIDDKMAEWGYETIGYDI